MQLEEEDAVGRGGCNEMRRLQWEEEEDEEKMGEMLCEEEVEKEKEEEDLMERGVGG